MIEFLYKQWCKETKRSGSVLVGGSIKEFFEWLTQNNYKIVKESINIDENKEETLEAKLRNQLTPIYGLSDIIIKSFSNDMLLMKQKPELKNIILDQSIKVFENKDKIENLLKEIEDEKFDTDSLNNYIIHKHTDEDFKMYPVGTIDLNDFLLKKLSNGVDVVDSIKDGIKIIKPYIWNEGYYINICVPCKKEFIGQKMQRVCKNCCETIEAAVLNK